MRLSIFIGLLYVAWCINPTTFDSTHDILRDTILINVVFALALIGDIKDLLKKTKMKTVLSTKELARVIKKAIGLRCESFEYNPETKELVFNKENDLYLDVHHLQKEIYEHEKFTFDTIQMFKVLNFLKELEEQPIVVEFDQYEDDKISIELSQFVKSF